MTALVLFEEELTISEFQPQNAIAHFNYIYSTLKPKSFTQLKRAKVFHKYQPCDKSGVP